MDITIELKSNKKEIEKGDKIYSVYENAKDWRITRKENGLTINFKFSKKDYPTMEDIKEFIKENDCF